LNKNLHKLITYLLKTIFYSFSIFALLFTVVLLNACKEADPSVQFVISKTTADVGEEIEFTNGSQGAATYEWDFGDGTTSSEENPKKKYSKPGKFTVTLTGITKKKKIEKSKSLEIQINSTEEYCKGSIEGATFEFTLDDANTSAAFLSNLSLAVPPNNSSGFFGYGFDNNTGKGIDVYFGKLLFQGSEPDSNAFKAMFAPGQKNYLLNENAINLGVEIRYSDGAGNVFSSYEADQSGQSFNVSSRTSAKDANGEDLVVVKATFSCRLKNINSSQEITLTNGSFYGRFNRNN
jgi:PKD repeat protein